MKYIILSCLLLHSTIFYAQAPSIQLMNVENRAYYNPALTGLKNKSSVDVFHRTQWANNYKQNYRLYGLQAEYSPSINNDMSKIGIGLNIYNEQQHIINSTTCLLQTGVRRIISQDKENGDVWLSGGFAFGVVSRSINLNSAVIHDLDDQLLQELPTPNTNIVGRAGLSLQNIEKWGIDVSLNNINGEGNKLNFNTAFRWSPALNDVNNFDIILHSNFMMPKAPLKILDSSVNQELGGNIRFKHKWSDDKSLFFIGGGYSMSLSDNAPFTWKAGQIGLMTGLQIENITINASLQDQYLLFDAALFKSVRTVEIRLGYLIAQ